MNNYLLQMAIDKRHIDAPQNIAISFNTKHITNKELFLTSNKLSHGLESVGVERHDRVAICLERSFNSIISILGVLKTDAIYVPIDPKSPPNRSSIILGDCTPKAIICDSSTLDNVLLSLKESHQKATIILLDYKENHQNTVKTDIVFLDEIKSQLDTVPEYKNIDTDIAYILYTSGSTGKPKGVVISHLNIINYINWGINYIGITDSDNILSTAPFHFDMSTFDIYCSLIAGSTLVIVPENFLLFPTQILKLIEQEKVTVWKAISSLLVYLSKTSSLKAGGIASLKKILFAGEVLPTKHLINWMEHYPEKLYFNAYGPTEATGVSIYYQVETTPASPSESIPIGKACPNSEVFLLSEDNTAVKSGDSGEICIRGSGLSGGYWNDEEKTIKSFTHNPLSQIPGDRIYRTGDLGRMRADGNIEFIGRKDFQIKYMGYRIELAEIETAITSIEGVNETAVILANSNNIDMPEMAAFYDAKTEIDNPYIMNELKYLLPPHMVPKHFFKIDKMPRTDRGKLDRPSLQKLYISRLNEKL